MCGVVYMCVYMYKPLCLCAYIRKCLTLRFVIIKDSLVCSMLAIFIWIVIDLVKDTVVFICCQNLLKF